MTNTNREKIESLVSKVNEELVSSLLNLGGSGSMGTSSVTLESILESINSLKDSDLFRESEVIPRFAGLPIRESEFIPHEEPKLTLSKDVEVSPNFRIAFNRWLLEEFGTKGADVAYLTKTMFGSEIIMHPSQVVKLSNLI